MRIAVVGGRLQGMEAVYLARKAGWETLLIDKTDRVPARTLCDRFVALDITSGVSAIHLLKDVDLIVPALEEADALSALEQLSLSAAVPFAFDPDAFVISSSKNRTNNLLSRMQIPHPRSWPSGRFPMVVKPDASSGSRGVSVLRGPEDLVERFKGAPVPVDWVVQEFVAGPTFSLEVIGEPGHYLTPQVTDLFMDNHYDCMRVTAPSTLSREHAGRLTDISVQIAEEMGLRGIMDVEVVWDGGDCNVLEIDARLPSQTPIAVFWSTGINMLDIIRQLFIDSVTFSALTRPIPRPVLCEHIAASGGLLAVCGEHVMSEAASLRVEANFFGATEAITNFSRGRDRWQATMIYAGGSESELLEQRNETMHAIRSACRYPAFFDPKPPCARQVEEIPA